MIKYGLRDRLGIGQRWRTYPAMTEPIPGEDGAHPGRTLKPMFILHFRKHLERIGIACICKIFVYLCVKINLNYGKAGERQNNISYSKGSGSGHRLHGTDSSGFGCGKGNRIARHETRKHQTATLCKHLEKRNGSGHTRHGHDRPAHSHSSGRTDRKIGV